jgi:apolipoprotein N-acyltransferase
MGSIFLKVDPRKDTRLSSIKQPRRGLAPAYLISASLSGIMWFLACPRFDIWPLAWVAMLPSLFAIERASTIRQATFLAWWTGFVGNIGGFYWIIGVLQRFGNFSLVTATALFIVMCAYQALRFLLFGWVFRTIRCNTRLPAAVVAPVVMVTVEVCVPFIFPYYLAITQAWQTHVIQIADLTGPLGVTALLLMINGALYDVATQGRRRLTAAICAIGIVVAALIYGHLRISQFANKHAAAQKLKVGIVQPNTSFEQKNAGTANNILADLQSESAKLEADGAELIVWTETIYPSVISSQGLGDWHEGHPRRIRRGFTSPLILGAITADMNGPDYKTYNSALLLERNGVFTARYDKKNLMPFGEYAPGVQILPSIQKLVPDSFGRFTPGTETITFTLRTNDGREWRLGPMICIEDVLPSYGRELGRLRPHLLVNITDDSWFGDTSEPWQHLALSVYRSVELRTEMVRAVNPGVSAYVDAAGRIQAKTYSTDPIRDLRSIDKLLVEVALIEGGHTIYAIAGDFFGYMNIAITLYLWLILPRLLRRKHSSMALSSTVLCLT